MPKRLLLLAFTILIFALSCAKSGFSVENTRLRRDIRVEVGRSGEDFKIIESVILTPLFNGESSAFNFRVVDPSESLRWEGEIKNEVGASLALEITPGAFFPIGEYRILYIDGDEGDQAESRASLSELDRNFPSFRLGYGLKSSYDVDIKELDNSGNLIRETKGAKDGFIPTSKTVRAEISYTDKFSNKIKVNQTLL